MGILWFRVVWLAENTLILGGVTNFKGIIRDDSLANTPPSAPGIYYGAYGGDIGLGSGFGTFLSICSNAHGAYSYGLQIAYEHYSSHFGIRFSYVGYYGWKIL